MQGSTLANLSANFDSSLRLKFSIIFSAVRKVNFMSAPFLSICIPSYNRPAQLLRLLRTIDTKAADIQIVICEDKAPRREEVRAAVEEFKRETSYEVKYIENEVNKGYDWNIRDFIIQADGEYNMYMGDDDGFIPGALDQMIEFLRSHRELGYVMRSSRTTLDGELMRYYPGTKFFEPGMQAYVELFRKSVFISGFTYKRELVKDSMTDVFDGSLLYQLYIVAEICLKHPSAYFDVPLTHAYEEEKQFFFGSSEKEKGKFVPNKISVFGSMKFVINYITIAKYIDEKYGVKSTRLVQLDVSKYSYPILSYLQQIGRVNMLKCAWEMWKVGYGKSVYFYIYVCGLLFLGKRMCDKIILLIKNKLGRTPQL